MCTIVTRGWWLFLSAVVPGLREAVIEVDLRSPAAAGLRPHCHCPVWMVREAPAEVGLAAHRNVLKV